MEADLILSHATLKYLGWTGKLIDDFEIISHYTLLYMYKLMLTYSYGMIYTFTGL